MRKQFVNSLIKLAKKDKDIFLLTGDLGFNVLEPFIKKFPKKYINCGCIEQSMVGIAAGMASMGKKVYVYSNSCFLIYRALEQMRNDVIEPGLNVKFIGTQGSQYNFLGISHNIGKDDVSILRLFQPKIDLYLPKNIRAVEQAVNLSYKSKKPSYIRL